MAKRPFYTKSPLRVFGLEFLSGLFFLSAMLVLVYFTAVINGAEWLSGRKPLKLSIQFTDVGDLGKNSKVCFRGMQIGRVTGLGMSPDYSSVRVAVALDEQIIIYKNYTVTVRQSSVFGGSYMAIDAGTPSAGELAGEEEIELYGSAPTDLLHDATELVSALRKDEAIFRKEFLEGELLENLAEVPGRIAVSVEAFRGLIDEMREGEGTFARVLNDSSLYFDMKKTLIRLGQTAEEVNELSSKLTRGNGAAAKLLNEPEFYNEMLSAVKEFKLTLNDMRPAAANLGEFTRRLSDEKGSLGRLLSDNGELYGALRKTLSQSDEMMDEIRNSRGSLGLLINDPSLYQDAKETVRQLRGAIEDFREQSPIITFGSLMMGGL